MQQPTEKPLKVANVATLALYTMLNVACCHSECCLLSVLELQRLLAASFYVIVHSIICFEGVNLCTWKLIPIKCRNNKYPHASH